MNEPAAITPAVDQQVTASDLVRHFGIWQECAARAPVYILNRGRPRFVLVSFDLMDALCMPHREVDASGADRAECVADALDDIVMLFDRQGRLSHANPAARKRLGLDLHEGMPATHLSRVSGCFLADAVARVASGGEPETLDLIPDRFAGRRLTARIEPIPEGALIHARDATAAEELREREADLRALHAAADAVGPTALARINPRGFLIEPSGALARLTGTSVEQLASARFLTLLAVSDRARIGDALDRLFTAGEAVSERASLLVRGATAQPVALAFAAVRFGPRIDEVVAMLVPDMH